MHLFSLPEEFASPLSYCSRTMSSTVFVHSNFSLAQCLSICGEIKTQIKTLAGTFMPPLMIVSSLQGCFFLGPFTYGNLENPLSILQPHSSLTPAFCPVT